MYKNREVYAGSPLALVTAEARLAYSPRLRQQDTLDQVALALEHLLPIARTEPRTVVTVTPTGVGQTQGESAFRLLNRASTVSATLAPTTITVETTSYREFDDFLKILRQVYEAVASVRAGSVVERVGLRYIDEIRVAETISDVRSWRGWIADGLLDLVDIASVSRVETCQGLAQYDLGGNRRLLFRYAALNGQSVVGNDPLRRKPPQPGPFFVIDIDASWEQRDELPGDFDPTWLADTLASLHDPAGEAFQNAITDRSRRLFREAV